MLIAFAKAYLFSIWLLLILGWMDNNGMIHFRDASQAMSAGILGMAVILGLCWLWYNRLEDLDKVTM